MAKASTFDVDYSAGYHGQTVAVARLGEHTGTGQNDSPELARRTAICNLLTTLSANPYNDLPGELDELFAPAPKSTPKGGEETTANAQHAASVRSMEDKGVRETYAISESHRAGLNVDGEGEPANKGEQELSGEAHNPAGRPNRGKLDKFGNVEHKAGPKK